MPQLMHETVWELEPPLVGSDGRLYRVTVVGEETPDGGWHAWLEFVTDDPPQVWRTGIETLQPDEQALHHWASQLRDVYLQGALTRAALAPVETAAHAEAIDAGADLDLYVLLALGEHVLRRELLLLPREDLFALVRRYNLNPRGARLSVFSDEQLVAFIVAALAARRH